MKAANLPPVTEPSAKFANAAPTAKLSLVIVAAPILTPAPAAPPVIEASAKFANAAPTANLAAVTCKSPMFAVSIVPVASLSLVIPPASLSGLISPAAKANLAYGI